MWPSFDLGIQTYSGEGGFKSVTINLTGGVKVNDSNVITANLITKNGVIHVIDTVLLPN